MQVVRMDLWPCKRLGEPLWPAVPVQQIELGAGSGVGFAGRFD